MTRGERPRLSQHFLHDRGVARRIADALGAPEGADVLEVGPGEGALTEHLLDRGWSVTAVEIDPALVAELRKRWGDRDGLRVVESDILAFELGRPAATGSEWYVVGNLPYAITTPILFHLFGQAERVAIAEMILMVQREVAERLVAEPGTKQRGALTVTVRLAADVEILFSVKPGSFRPPPRVDSSVVRLTPHDRWGIDPARRVRVRALVQALFGQRRKQLQKSLRSLDPWRLGTESARWVGERSGIDLSRRPETLDMAEWLRLDEALARTTRAEES